MLLYCFKIGKVTVKVQYYCHYFLIWSLLSSASTAKPCAHFHFENTELSGNVLEIEENTSFSILFSLINASCPSLNDVIVHIYSLHPYDLFPTSECDIKVKNGLCSDYIYTKVQCNCRNQEWKYNFTAKLMRSESKVLKWSEFNGLAEDMVLTIKVIYPPRLRSLIVTGFQYSVPHIVPRNHSIQVSCLWDNGIPPRTAYLVDSAGKILDTSNDYSGNISHSIPLTQCSDSGQFLCHADEAKINKSLTLLVECPPQLGKPMIELQSAQNRTILHLDIPLHTHSTNITRCELVLYSQHNEPRIAEKCAIVFALQQTSSDSVNCTCRVSGAPPACLLVVVVYEVSERDGRWHILVANNVGSDHYPFPLSDMYEPMTYSSPKTIGEIESTTATSNGSTQTPLVFYIWGILTALLSIFAIFAIFLFLKGKLKRGNRNSASDHLGSGKKHVSENIQHEFPKCDGDDHEYSTIVDADIAVFDNLHLGLNSASFSSGAECGSSFMRHADGMTKNISSPKNDLQSSGFQKTEPEIQDYLMPCVPKYSSLDFVTRDNSDTTLQYTTVPNTSPDYLTPCPSNVYTYSYQNI